MARPERSCFHRTAGFAIDEAILATIMTASFAAMVVVTVPWSRVFNDGVAIASYLETIEQANIAFHRHHNVWPHETTSGDPVMNIAALTSTQAMKWPYNTMVSFRNYLSDVTPGYKTGGVRHDYGSGGSVSQQPVFYRGQRYMQVSLADVPISDARKLDIEMDGNYDPSFGRVTFIFNPQNTDIVTVNYRANALDI